MIKKEDDGEVHGSGTGATPKQDSTIPWKPRTNITIHMRSKKTAAIGLKEQNSDVRKVIHASYEFGRLALIIGDVQEMLDTANNALLRMNTPFGARGLEHIALRALIKAAESNGYDGEFDIAHRLEQGSDCLYTEPLQDYVRLHPFSQSFS